MSSLSSRRATLGLVGVLWVASTWSLYAGRITRLQSPAPAWKISLRMSGGFEGVDRQATLTSTGELIASDRKRRIEVTTQTSVDTIARISSLVSQIASIDAPRGAVCHDCLLYDLDIRAGNRILTGHVNEAELAGNEVLQKLVDALSSVIRAALGG